MEIEFHPAEDRENRRKHGVPLAFGARVLTDPRRLIDLDAGRDCGEERWIVLGAVDGRVYVCVCTERGEAFRIISVRRAIRREENRYYQAQD